MALVGCIASVPRSHLAKHRRVGNQVMLNMGVEQTQKMATVLMGYPVTTQRGYGSVGICMSTDSNR